MKKYRTNLKHSKEGYTFIELLVVMVVLALLVLFAVPNFIGRTKEAEKTKHISSARNIQDASERYFISEKDWPRLTDNAYTSEEVEAYADTIYSITGDEITLNPNGNYYNIDYDALSKYVTVADEDKNNYILQNPVGKVYYLEGLSDEGKIRADYGVTEESSEEKDNTTIMDVMEYKDDDTPIAFHGLTSEAFDADNTSYYIKRSNETDNVVTWDGNLTHRIVSIQGESANSYSMLLLRFLDEDNNTVQPLENHENTIMISHDGKTKTINVMIPEGADKMKFEGSEGFKIHDISFPEKLGRPEVQNVTHTSAHPNVTLSWNEQQRVRVYEEGVLLADVNDTAFTHGPYFANTPHKYDLFFIDEYGNGQKATYVAKSEKTAFNFNGLAPEVFDGDDRTYFVVPSEGMTLSWDGDLSYRVIKIVGETERFKKTYAEFLDKHGNLVQPLETKEDFVQIFDSNLDQVVEIVVPEGAQQMRFYGSGRAWMHEISAPKHLSRPGVPNITTNVTTSSVSFDWGTEQRVRIYKDGAFHKGVTAASYTDSPLYSSMKHSYQLVFLDSEGNGDVASYETITKATPFNFRGLGPAAFDGNTRTVHKVPSSGEILTWEGDLSNRTLSIEGKTRRFYSSFGQFLDKEGSVVQPIDAATDNSVRIFNSNTNQTTDIVVPDGARGLRIYGAHDAEVYEVTVK